MAETLEFDPASEASGSPLTITTGSYGLLEHRYPTPPLSAQWASSVDTEGAALASKKHDNREISITVDVTSSSALATLQGKIGKLYREGGTLKRTLPGGTTIIFDVLTVSNFDPSFDHAFDLADLASVPISLVCKPYGRGAEVDLGDNVETTLPVLRFTEATVAGDMPALGRLVIDNDDAVNAKGLLIWGQRSRTYSSASSAALFYEAEACAMNTAAAAVGTAGASGAGSNVAKKLNVGTSSGVVLLYVGPSATAQTHIGSYRVFARVLLTSGNTGSMSIALEWEKSAQDSSARVSNTAVTVPSSLAGSWLLVDLGMVTLPRATTGTQGWRGLLTAWSTVAGDDIEIDCFALVPADEGYGFANQPTGVQVIGGIATGGGQAEIRHDGALRSLGVYWTDIATYEGDHLLVPPSGAEAYTLEMIVLLNDGALPGTGYYGAAGIPDLSARLFVTPRYLVVPA